MTVMTRPLLRLGTRGSLLALAQTGLVRDALAAAWPALAAPGAIETVVVRTTGDRIQDRPLSEIGGKGLFTKELEEALLDGSIDAAVHSVKDLPAELPAPFVLAATLPRETPFDALISRHPCDGLAGLPRGARIGTSALRRQAQLLAQREDLSVGMLRGNIDTRLRKVGSGDFDAILLAAAGLRRLGLDGHITCLLDADSMLPAVGQGAIGCETRAGDAPVRTYLEAIDHAPTHHAVRAERAMLRVLEGNCRTPIAGLARTDDGGLTLNGLVVTPDGRQGWRISLSGGPAECVELGREVGHEILRMAGDDFPRVG
jgi:hydroxymethylbilane synthase